MKAEELMIGDWVLVKELDYSNLTNVISEYQHQLRLKDFAEMYNAGEYKKYEPIPLTKEILEKNGFTKYDVGHNVSGWSIMDDDNLYSAISFTLTDNDFDTELGDYKWGPVEDDREESFVREVGRIKYVHELQHILKLCKIEKEIVL